MIITIKTNANLNSKNAIKLFYFKDFEREMRLYISTKILKHEAFKLIYNKMKYFDYTRIHEKYIRNVYIFNMLIKLYKYFRHCSHC